MMVRVLLVCEGSSDAPLASHTQALLRWQGIAQSEQLVSYSGRRLRDKIRSGLERFGDVDLLFVHRDADRAGADARYREIAAAVRQSGYGGPWVGIAPVRMTEAWLLSDEVAIRNAARNPSGRMPLNLPRPAALERLADPKAELDRALLAASGVGRRRVRNRSRLPESRRALLENLPVGGPLEQVQSWVRFRDDTIAALRSIAS